MDKIQYLQELTTISDDNDINLKNFGECMRFSNSVNLFYEALNHIANQYGAVDEISVASVDFSKFTVPPGQFEFKFSRNVKNMVDCNKTIECSIGRCIIRENENAAGYAVETQLY